MSFLLTSEFYEEVQENFVFSAHFFRNISLFKYLFIASNELKVNKSNGSGLDKKKAGMPKDGQKQNPAVYPHCFLAPLPFEHHL